MSFEGDLRAKLVPGVIATAAAFEGPIRKVGNGIPHQAIFITPVGSPPPFMYMDGGADLRRYNAQVYVRSNPNAYTAGLALAEAAYNALHKASISGYVRVVAEQSAPAYIGLDAQEHHEWTFTVQGWK